MTAQSDLVDRKLARCSSIGEDSKRLECFEMIAKNRGVWTSRKRKLPDDAGSWNVNRKKNPIDDSETVFATLTAVSGESRYGDKITLIARCKSNKTEAYINWNDFLGDDTSSVYSDSKYVTTRVGDLEAKTRTWGTSTDRKATFAPAWAGDLLKEIMMADSFVAQTTPYGENPITAVFDTTGAKSAFRPIADVCGWSVGE